MVSEDTNNSENAKPGDSNVPTNPVNPGDSNVPTGPLGDDEEQTEN